jgi:4-carboxymuconolactone decarboxylase
MRFPLAMPPYDEKVQQTMDKVDLGPLSPQNFLRVLAHQPRLMGNVVALGGSLMYKGALCERQREIAIFRVAVRTRCDYEWAMHRALFAERCAITDEQLQALQNEPPIQPCWTVQEQLLIAAVDELHERSTITESTWASMGAHWSPPELLEIIILIGHYHLVAFFMNATGTGPEEGAMHLAVFGALAKEDRT